MAHFFKQQYSIDPARLVMLSKVEASILNTILDPSHPFRMTQLQEKFHFGPTSILLPFLSATRRAQLLNCSSARGELSACRLRGGRLLRLFAKKFADGKNLLHKCFFAIDNVDAGGCDGIYATACKVVNDFCLVVLTFNFTDACVFTTHLGNCQ